MKRRYPFAHPPSRQSGMILVFSLVFLLVMTLIGVAGMQNSSLEEKMAGNVRDRQLAFQAAESTLRAAESFLKTSSATALFNCSAGLYRAADANCDNSTETTTVWDAINWSDAAKTITYAGATLSGVASQPTYIIEQLPDQPDSGGSLQAGTAVSYSYYRITVKASGGSSAASALVQSTYRP